MIELSARNLVFVSQASTIDRMGSNSKIGKAKVKNMIIFNLLTKSKLLVKLSSEMGFLTFEARLAFTKLKETLIDVLIFHHFDLKYHIQIKTDILNNAISEILN